jgi:2-polyprenyl-3-methyl-5-hydroxy-6-metoxy-1,4-benzoquinol methylase
MHLTKQLVVALASTAIGVGVVFWWWKRYTNDLEITDEMLEFLKQYTNVQDSQRLRSHVLQVVEQVRASNLHMYGCIKKLAFLKPHIQKAKTYEEMLKRIDSIEVADVGCAFGQETRRLVLDGILPKKITAIDLHDGYWNLGKQLFMDAATIDQHVTSVFGDIAKPVVDGGLDLEANMLLNRFDYVLSNAVLHCLSQKQVEVFLRNVFQMLKPDANAKFLGWTIGTNDQPAEMVSIRGGTVNRYLHTSTTLEELLKETGFTHVRIRAVPRDFSSVLGANRLKLQITEQECTRTISIKKAKLSALLFSAIRP